MALLSEWSCSWFDVLSISSTSRMWDDKTRLVSTGKRGGIVKRVFRERCIVTTEKVFIETRATCAAMWNNSVIPPAKRPNVYYKICHPSHLDAPDIVRECERRIYIYIITKNLSFENFNSGIGSLGEWSIFSFYQFLCCDSLWLLLLNNYYTRLSHFSLKSSSKINNQLYSKQPQFLFQFIRYSHFHILRNYHEKYETFTKHFFIISILIIYIREYCFIHCDSFPQKMQKYKSHWKFSTISHDLEESVYINLTRYRAIGSSREKMHAEVTRA